LRTDNEVEREIGNFEQTKLRDIKVYSAAVTLKLDYTTSLKQHAAGDNRLLPDAAIWRTGRNIRVVFDSGPFDPLCEQMTSSTKPEVHNILHCGQKRTEPRPQVACTENLMKFGHMILRCANRQTDKRTDRQNTDVHADTLTEILCTPIPEAT